LLTATLDTTVQNDLLASSTNTSNNLQSRLASLPSPANNGFFAPRIFGFGASLIIGGAQSQVTRDIVSAVNQYNASLAGSTSSG
jgi:hypothetical protein